ncbi:MAG: hypothetical protein QM749_08055 [Aquabacterium sp.]
MLHGIAGFIQAVAGGQNGAAGALAAMGNEKLTQQINDYINQQVPITSQMSPQQQADAQQARKELAEAAASMIGAGTVALAGGVTGKGSAQDVQVGGQVALTADRFNRQLHPTEIQWIKDNASRYAALKGISTQDAEKQLAAQAFRQVQFGAEGGAAAWDADAQAFLKSAGTQALPNGGFMFYATPDQKADATMYLDSAIKNADFYAKNGLKQPTLADLQVAAQRDAGIRANLGTATKTALAASATLNLVALAPTTLGWVLAHPVEASTAGIISAETAAAITSGAVTPTSLAPMLSAGGMKVVTTMGEAVSGQAAKATAGGYINAAKVCESGCAITGLSQSEQALVTQIQAGKDTGGQLTEQLLESVASRTGSTVLAGGKYGGNNGFDLVLKNADGTITVVMDGKQVLQSGAFSLSANSAGGNTQNSVAWVDEVLRKLDKSSAAYKAVDAATRNNTLVTAVGGVNRTTGQLVVLPVTVPVPGSK